ncbi:CPBP family intramembrane metalloprotease [Massilia sp. CCM 9210]|uniref:CPBP family intramembrane glutamic endopeptidase n=1 Tax=Massilia scottii TaxID=3057166 RepID=UPI0027967911|nr:CPBP family intramembrane glutamic endopeptidase [Massilia sp. CCM 9210]MDQ1812279.1 CPBP family intramembrane metalloprotease [Massilia sp. CCM 9210]
MLHLSVALVTTYGLLALAVCALWLAPLKLRSGVDVPPWLCLLVLACASGVATGLLSLQALAAIAVLGALAYAAKRSQSGPLHVFLMVAMGCMMLAMSLHRFPGFVNPPLVTDMVISAAAEPVTHRLNFDKAAAGLILFALFCVPARTREQWREVGRHYWIILGTPLLVLPLGVLVGDVDVDLKLFAYTPVFIALNLLFTCVTEEAFFRGFIQEQLARAMQRWKAGPGIAMCVAALLFGLAHAGGGWPFAGLASLAGLGYGYAYLRSKRIETAILAHLALNGIHFIAFTYPRLSPA